MWVSVYMSQNVESAKIMREKIENFNILVMLRCISSNDGNAADCYELLVPKTEVNEALGIIID